MIALVVGDVVGRRATDVLAAFLPELRHEYGADVVVVNAENCARSGVGTAIESIELLLASGADVITGGNHSWEGPDAAESLAHPRVLRPLNLTDGVAGRGSIALRVRDEPLTVLNLADMRALSGVAALNGHLVPPYDAWLGAQKAGTVIVDFHGDHVLEKHVFACAVDGEAAAVIGTHSHEPTLPLYVLAGGTAFVSDVGMTGPQGGVQGFRPQNFVSGLKRVGDYLAEPLPFPADGPIVLGAVVLETSGGWTRRFERVPRERLLQVHEPVAASAGSAAGGR